MKTLGETLKELRIDKGLTQKEMAAELSVSIPTLSHWECNYQEPCYDDLRKLCSFFNVSVSYLLGQEDDFGNVTVQSSAPTYSNEEQKLIEDYRGLSRPLKDLLQEMIRTWQQSSRAENVPTKERK